MSLHDPKDRFITGQHSHCNYINNMDLRTVLFIYYKTVFALIITKFSDKNILQSHTYIDTVCVFPYILISISVQCKLCLH